ncbi:uncharacterized protein BDV14DRAFT_195346 [Aspergillus stella-maris]|uniref:uncharacterized protein n=1 Tax=Aspergillus stella-maris TaxID=1810926 RepID=UPI003CCE030C
MTLPIFARHFKNTRDPGPSILWVLQTKIPEVVSYGTKFWNIGLVLPHGYATTQLARTKNDGDDHFNLMLGLVASQDAVQFHALRDDGHFWSTAIIGLTTTDGLAMVWAFLRWIIHDTSTREPGRSEAMYPDGVQHDMSSVPPLMDPIRRDGHLGGLQDKTTTERSTFSSLYGFGRSTPITGCSDDGDSQASYHQLESDENELQQLHAK